MSFGTVSDVNYLLKQMYMDNESIEQWAKATLLYQVFNRDSKYVKGTAKSSGFSWPIEDVRNTRGGAVPMTGSNAMKFIPPGGRQGVQASSTLKMSEIGVIFDDVLFDAAKDGQQAFYNVTKRNMTTLFEDARNMENRMMWSDGSGVLATIGAVTSGTVLTLADSGLRYFPLTLYLRPGQLITFLTSAYASISSQSGITITEVDDEAGTITVADTTGLNAGDVITNYFAHDAGSTTGNEPTGLLAIHGDDDTLFGIDPDDHPLWVPGYQLTGNTDPTDAVIKLANTRIKMKGGNANKKVILSSPLAQDKYAQALYQMRRAVNTTDIKGGVDGSNDLNKPDGIDIANVGEFYADLSCPQGLDPNTSRMWIGDPTKQFVEQASDLHWFEQSGQVLWPLIGSASVGSESVARWVAYAVHYWEICTMKRNAGGMLHSVNVLQAP